MGLLRDPVHVVQCHHWEHKAEIKYVIIKKINSLGMLYINFVPVYYNTI